MTDLGGAGLERLHGPSEHLHLTLGEDGSRAVGLSGIVAGVRHCECGGVGERVSVWSGVEEESKATTVGQSGRVGMCVERQAMRGVQLFMFANALAR
jgi:hypothetical protein